jgi:hypothetical protein
VPKLLLAEDDATREILERDRSDVVPVAPVRAALRRIATEEFVVLLSSGHLPNLIADLTYRLRIPRTLEADISIPAREQKEIDFCEPTMPSKSQAPGSMLALTIGDLYMCLQLSFGQEKRLHSAGSWSAGGPQ